MLYETFMTLFRKNFVSFFLWKTLIQPVSCTTEDTVLTIVQNISNGSYKFQKIVSKKNDFILNSACFIDSSFCNLLWQNLTLSVSLKRKSAVAFLPKKVSKIVPKIVKLFFFKYCPNFLKNEGVCLENPQSCYGPA